MKFRHWIVAAALLLSASSAFGLISKTIKPGGGGDFLTFQAACTWLKTETQPLTDDYEFVADSASYAAAATLDSINSGTRSVTFRATYNGAVINVAGATFGFYVRKTANVTLRGIIFRKSGAPDSAAICFRSSPNGHVRRCSVSTTGGGSYGIWADQSPDLRIDTCGIYNTGSYAVYLLNSLRGRLKGCRVNIAGYSYVLNGSDSTLIDSCSSVGNCSRGFFVFNSSDTRARVCSLASTPGVGFYVDSSNRVKLDSCLVQGADNQCFYFSYSRSCRMFKCRMGGSPTVQAIYVGAGCHYDSVLACQSYAYTNNGIRLDAGSGAHDTANVFANNLFYNHGGTVGGTAYAILANKQYRPGVFFNTLYDIGNNMIRRYGIECDNCLNPKIKNNIICVNGKDSATTVSPCLYFGSGNTLAAGDCDFNDFFAPLGSVAYYSSTKYATLPAWQAVVGCDSHSLAVDPCFPPTPFDFTLLDTSHCIKAGTPIPGVTKDFAGTTRHPFNPCIGFWEYIPSAPGAFTLLAPGNGAQNQPVNVRLRWDVSAQADSYVVYLDRSPSPTTVISRQTDTGYTCSGLLNDSTYYWRIEAKNWPSGLTPSATWSFRTIEQAPAAFANLWPTNFSGNQPVNGTLVWQRSARADSYHVYLDTLDPPVYSPGWTTDTTFAYGGLKHFYYYYWKVTALNGGGTISSSQFAFQTVIDTPGTFPLRTPANGDSNLGTSGSLYWGISALADSYIVYLDTLSPPVNVLFRRNSLDTTWSYSGLDSGDYYYWRVRAKNAGGITASSIFSFRTVGASVGTFVLLAPADGSTDQPDDVRLRWQVAANADTYAVYLDRNPSPTTVLSRQTDTGYDCSGLLLDSVYYWKVVAKRNPGSTFTAGPWWFRVRATPPDTIWVPEPSPPLGGKNKAISDGGAMASLPGNGDTTYSFLLKGNNTCEFYVYNSATGAWSTLDSIPRIGRSSKKKTVKKGSALVAVEGRLYAFKGNNTNDFWCYTPSSPGPSGIATSGWQQLPDVPGDKKCKDGTDAATVVIDGAPYVYLLKGGTNEFYRNNVVAKGSWETLTGAPLLPSGKVYKTGSAIVYYPDDKVGAAASGRIFALKGSYNEFHAFDLLTGGWSDKASLPLTTPPSTKKTKCKAGAGLAYSPSPKLILALKGNKTVEFWKYQAAADAWTRGKDVPLAPSGKKVGAGGSISCVDGIVHIIKGNKTSDFYSLPVSESDEGLLLADGLVKSVQGRSAVHSPQFALSVTPNPLASSRNPSISYSLPQAGNLCLKLYDISGKLVGTLASGYYPAGSYSLQLTANSLQQKLAAGIYVLRLDSDSYRATEKLIIE